MNNDLSMIERPEYKKKSIRSFVIRGGRITDAQKKAFAQWWPIYGLSLYSGPLQLENIFPVPDQPLVIEVGFGMGESLLAMAQSDPDKNFIGIEVHPPGVGRLINSAGKLGIDNLRVYMADASDVLEDCIPDCAIDRFQLFFPDPWHKKKHNKRRIIQSKFIDLVWRKLKPGGVFHAATDWQEYAEYAMELFSAHAGYQNFVGEYQFAERPLYRPKTKFEARGENLGHGVYDTLFIKV